MPAHSPTLEVDLHAIRANYRLLKGRHAKQSAAAVVKANAYGLGMKAVSEALWQEGCRMFFVATLEEGAELRKLLPDARIGVFNGLLKRQEKKYVRLRLTPVLNDREQVERWEKAAAGSPAMVHVDTGMTRLGLSQDDLQRVATRYNRFVTQTLAYLISHLACANEPDHPKNAEQLARFREALKLVPGVKASLSNSSGLFLPADFHFDMARPGCALYGINPTDGANPMQPVATLSAPLLQVRTLERNESVGYGATAKAAKGSRIAIVAMGYADGWRRDLSNRGSAYVAGHKVPVLGRVSMDMMALDITSVPTAQVTARLRAEFINGVQTVDDIASACATIGYEIFTRIGERVQRTYSGS